jgi:hypothetical protein
VLASQINDMMVRLAACSCAEAHQVGQFNDVPVQFNDVPVQFNDVPVRQFNDVPVRQFNDLPVAVY